MSFRFTNSDIERISAILGAEPESFGDSWVWSLRNAEHDKPMVVSLYNNVPGTNDEDTSLISVQTRHGYYELHELSSYMLFEPDEAIFVCSKESLMSCLIIGKGNTCSLYSNIRKEILDADFAELHPASLLAAMQLSIVEGIL